MHRAMDGLFSLTWFTWETVWANRYQLFWVVWLALIVLTWAGCSPGPTELPCFEIIHILPGYEAQVVDSLLTHVHPDSIWIREDSTVAARTLPRELCP